jgi:molecular chaperone GrpE (heat shock protein)
MTKFKPSAGMTYARAEVQKQRLIADAAAEQARAVAEAYRGGNATLEDVHLAEATLEAARDRVAMARRDYEGRRTAFAEKFVASLAPLDAALRADLEDVADRLEAAITPAREADTFALTHGLPLTRLCERATRLAGVIAQLREMVKQPSPKST